MRKFAPTRIADLRADRQGNQVLAGLIVAMRTMKTKRGDTMAILTLDDRSARIEVTVYADTFNESRDLLGNDRIVIVEGTVAHDDYSGGLAMRVKGVRDLTQARQSYASALKLELHREQLDEPFVQRLQDILAAARGGACPVSMVYLQGRNLARFSCGEQWKVSPTDELLQSLRDQLGPDRVTLDYQ